MIDGVDPGASSASGPGGTVGPSRDQLAKHEVSAALDLDSVRWERLRDESGAERGPVEYAFVPHSDGVTYVVLRSALRGASDGDDRRAGTEGVDGGRAGEGTVLVFTPSEWDAFLAGARDGEFDRPQD
ncbi:protein of unknown function (DUF397) [Prauserella aidingensis]|uniref:DUF397 domain-containing protein n=1 Tax=Prauserella aidingensis TaxID=387890 RepID=UPI0020A6037A|nr:DUF397 domain-containing protein [Prauserella aidingensis]MCP2254188.1 protein of unknown function (DUF397) [Prauserella aidingensis]